MESGNVSSSMDISIGALGDVRYVEVVRYWECSLMEVSLYSVAIVPPKHFLWTLTKVVMMCTYIQCTIVTFKTLSRWFPYCTIFVYLAFEPCSFQSWDAFSLLKKIMLMLITTH